MSKEIRIETIEKVIRYAKENPGLSNDDVGKLCGCSGSSVGIITRAANAFENSDFRDFTTAYLYGSKAIIEKVAILYNKTYEEVERTVTGKITHDTPTATITRPTNITVENENQFYVSVLKNLAYLPDLVKAVNNLNEKITILNQRMFESVNNIDMNISDLAEDTDYIKSKVSRITWSVSTMEDKDENGRPKTILDFIDEGFDDVCAKMDSLRQTIDKR